MTIDSRGPDTYADYRDAAVVLWGRAGAHVHDAYARWLHLFPGLPEQLPIVIGITAYGHCVGATLADWQHGPRITIASSLFKAGLNRVADTVCHEMVHAWLGITGQESGHDTDAWYEAVAKLSPDVLGLDLDVRRGGHRRSVRVPNPAYEPGVDDRKTVVRKRSVSGAVPHHQVAGWPASFRPHGHDWGEVIGCPTY